MITLPTLYPNYVTPAPTQLVRLAAQPECATEPVDILELRSALPGKYTMESVRRSGDYALATVGYPQDEGEGTVLLRKFQGHWQELVGGGGAMDTQQLNLFGVPRKHWQQLVGSQVSPPDLDQPGWPETSERRLSQDDLAQRSAFELTLMRNEIFARKGYEFQDPILREYFSSRPWYKVNPQFTPKSLSATENYNAELIQTYQNNSAKNF